MRCRPEDEGRTGEGKWVKIILERSRHNVDRLTQPCSVVQLEDLVGKRRYEELNVDILEQCPGLEDSTFTLRSQT